MITVMGGAKGPVSKMVNLMWKAISRSIRTGQKIVCNVKISRYDSSGKEIGNDQLSVSILDGKIKLFNWRITEGKEDLDEDWLTFEPESGEKDFEDYFKRTYPKETAAKGTLTIEPDAGKMPAAKLIPKIA